MRLAVDAVGEVEGARAAVSAAAPESQGPETARRVSRTGGDRDRAFELVVWGSKALISLVLCGHVVVGDTAGWKDCSDSDLFVVSIGGSTFLGDVFPEPGPLIVRQT